MRNKSRNFGSYSSIGYIDARSFSWCFIDSKCTYCFSSSFWQERKTSGFREENDHDGGFHDEKKITSLGTLCKASIK